MRTVTGVLSSSGRPAQVQVVRPGGTTPESDRPGIASLVGPSWLHAGYTEWNVTGPNPNHDTYHLSIPPVLPGGGGFFDADLEIAFAGGSLGSWQIPMFDCTVTGGPASLVSPAGPRTLSCSGTDADLAPRVVTAGLSRANAPFAIAVAHAGSPTADMTRARRAALLGASGLHPGYQEWDITGANPNHDLYRLSLPPVLPAVGGFSDATLEIALSGGTLGSVQIQMFDCTIS